LYHQSKISVGDTRSCSHDAFPETCTTYCGAAASTSPIISFCIVIA
jgi:hypothetical protein